MITVTIAGDLYPGPASSPHLRRGEAATVFGDLLPHLQDADLAIANLEGPVCATPSPIAKIGPLHAIHPECVQGIRAAGFRVLALANNHVMDHGAAGLATTIRACADHGIAVVGAGDRLEAAGRVLIREVRGVRLALLAYAEREFCVATDTKPGCQPLDLIHFLRTVERHAKSWDALIVLLHAGNEYQPYPRPSLRDLARFMVERGADAVVFQHSHCAGCLEIHQGRTIVHGQGNFLFDTRSARPCEQEGFLVTLRIAAPGSVSVDTIPFRQSPAGPGPRRLVGDEERKFHRGLTERSQALARPGFVEAEWDGFCRAHRDRYLALLHGRPSFLRKLDRRIPFLRWTYRRKRLAMLLHLLRCETHQETATNILTHELDGTDPTMPPVDRRP